MVELRSLTTHERAFFASVARLVVANPFGSEFAATERELVGPGQAPSHGRSVHELVGARLAALGPRDEFHLESWQERDRAILADVLLFDVYFTWADRFRDFIALQEATPDAPCTLGFGDAMLRSLVRIGIPRAEAVRYLAVFYQQRRAYVFIERALVGTSPCIQRLREALWNDIFTRDIRLYVRFLIERMEDFSTLLLGETGTGKGSAAGAIGRSAFIPYEPMRHRFAASFAETFVALNLSEFPETLIESALFGHEKGAFTGAVEKRDGVLASCSPFGAILLDEIGELAVPVQIKLLRVLQERAFTPVGGRKARHFRGRVIAATNRKPEELHPGVLRDDFYYRLCSDAIVVPPLRQRLAEAPAELELLVDRLLTRMLGDTASTLVDAVCTALERDVGRGYAWPGNVRELEQAVRRVLLKGRYDPVRTLPVGEDAFTKAIAAGELDARSLLAGYCSRLHTAHGSYEEVARRTGLDRRTAKRYVTLGAELRRRVDPPGANS